MIKKFKHFIQEILSIFNLKLQLVSEYSTAFAINKLNISLVIDVGANSGQLGSEIRREGYSGYIYSFEPLIEAHSRLMKRANPDVKWEVHPRCAVGDSVGEVQMNVAGNSYSSSIKEMLPSHSSVAPDSLKIGTHKAEVITLDSMLDFWQKRDGNIYLKIDTQGFEQEVISGATKTLKYVSAVQVELSSVELYKGQALYDYFFDFFNANNFQLYRIIPGFFDPKNGQLL